jgi:hypothetical protein
MFKNISSNLTENTALLLSEVNSVYANPIAICELNEAFFKDVAHMVTI